jgi:hypothetical protein
VACKCPPDSVLATMCKPGRRGAVIRVDEIGSYAQSFDEHDPATAAELKSAAPGRLSGRRHGEERSACRGADERSRRADGAASVGELLVEQWPCMNHVWPDFQCDPNVRDPGPCGDLDRIVQ